MARLCLRLVSTFYSFFTLGGCATLGFGIWSQMKDKSSDLLKSVDDLTLAPVLMLGTPMLIALGCILILMGIVGWLGTMKKKSWLLLVFFIVMLVIVILQVIVAVFLVLPSSVKDSSLRSLQDKLLKSLRENYKSTTDTSITNIWDEFMNKVQCCGYKGYDDFTSSTWLRGLYPMQCCGDFVKTQYLTCTKAGAEIKKITGCAEVLLNEHLPISGALSFLIAILEIVAMIISMKVYQWLKSLPDLPD